MKRILSLALAGALLTSSVAMAQQTMSIVKACAADIDRLCPGVPPGEGRIKACIKAHVLELSAPCMDELLKAIAAEKEPE